MNTSPVRDPAAATEAQVDSYIVDIARSVTSPFIVAADVTEITCAMAAIVVLFWQK